MGTLPSTAHCIQSYGASLTPVRAAIHSLRACFFYGAFAAKMMFVRSWRAGGSLVVTVVGVWYTSVLRLFDGFHAPEF